MLIKRMTHEKNRWEGNSTRTRTNTYTHLHTHLDSFKDLEHEVAVMNVVEGLLGFVDNVVEIAVQQLHDDVEFIIVLVDQQVFERHDVRVRFEIPGPPPGSRMGFDSRTRL